MYIHPHSTESLLNLNKIWYVGSGRWVIHDCIPYDPIQGQGHGGLKVVKMAKSMSSAGMCVIKRLMVNSDTTRQYLNVIRLSVKNE